MKPRVFRNNYTGERWMLTLNKPVEENLYVILRSLNDGQEKTFHRSNLGSSFTEED